MNDERQLIDGYLDRWEGQPQAARPGKVDHT